MKTYKILIIDDEIDTINIIIDSLEQENPNYVFFHATNGIVGIDVAKKHKPNLIITDWEMPHISGIETIKQLKGTETTSQIPIIMLTGIMTSSENLKTAFAAGAIDYIRKPIDKLELTARIRSMLMLSDYYSETISVKNRELASTAMNILQNNEFNLKIIEKLKSIDLKHGTKSKQLSSSLNELSQEVSAKIKNEAWNHFKTYFANVYPSFTKNLTTKFPELSLGEVKLASFLRLKLTTKEIASIIFISPDSVKTARNRLRKKLNLSAGENLTAFLMAL